MPLFAVMNNTSAIRVYRIETDKNTDVKIKASFQKQLTDFETDHHKILSFEAGYKPDSNECQKISNFDDADLLIDAVNRSTAIPKWDKSVGLDSVSALFMAPDFPQNPTKIAVQNFSKKQILSAAKYLWLSNNVFSMSDALGFNLDDKLVAVVNTKEIKFRSFTNLRSIFNMNKYFALATKTDLNNFTLESAFDVPQGFDLDAVADNVIRKKVALINKNGILNQLTVPQIAAAAQKLSFQLNTSGSGAAMKILMPVDKKSIKELLDFLDEDYFNSELTQVRYRSNSKRKA